MTRDPLVYLCHMQLCIERIALYTEEGRDAFFADAKTQDAVIRNLEIIGQAARDLGVERLAAAQPALPWSSIAGLRNVLAHQYLGVGPSAGLEHRRKGTAETRPRGQGAACSSAPGRTR